ncbi:hypothetical protein [Nonomuraea endophytica]|uniref:Uncharacterized protein n=1 Tax=Nonomuraea endophytica TaxID=714136 RepID=A0A7W8EHU4_9ACTN|nr:hypothetical protein [Nonomuraea endophytica]MBB5079796.1 hypothetical protein [Nonomuraea endophytica]
MADIPRRRFLGGAVAAGLAGALLPATSAQADIPSITADGITLVAAADGTITVKDGAGVERIRLTGFMAKDTVTGIQRTTGGTPSLITLPDGGQAIQVAYTLPAAAQGITVRGVFRVTPNRARLRWEVAGSATLIPAGFMLGRTVIAPTEPESFTALTRWNRDAGGGVPYETNAGVVYQETWGSARAYFRLGGTTPAWTNAAWIHAPATAADGGAVTEADLVLGSVRPAAGGTMGAGLPLGVEVWTDKPFSLWDGGGQPMALHAEVANGGTAARTVKLSWWARDFDGRVLKSGSVTGTVAAGSAWKQTFTVTSPSHGIVFTEVKATAGADSAFARTNLTVLPPYTYQAGADSMFGIANYPWLLKPDAAAVVGLMRRIGIKRVRISYDGGPGLPPATLNAAGIEHNIELAGIPLGGTPAEVAAWADTNTQKAIGSRADYFEVANEVNKPWMSGLTAAAYVRDGLRPVRERLTAAGAPTKVLNAGLAGMDYVWTKNFHDAGGWDLIDGFAFHPGRGNFTPDYAPPPEEWTQGNNGSYWNFLGSMRKAREMITEYGDKELWLTEAYACTKPNSWWHDTYRQAAENVLLTLALSMAEGVSCVNWYQLHDSVLGKPQMADPANAEYHFGLMNRDTSAKPSMLAYATAAKVLDQATFTRWLTFADPDLKGLLFSTPEGPVSILWSRKDGYLLNTDHEPGTGWFAAPEPWVDDWPTKTDVHVPAAGGQVRVLDCIGRERRLTPCDGKVKIRLDGAPRVYYGLTEHPDVR